MKRVGFVPAMIALVVLCAAIVYLGVSLGISRAQYTELSEKSNEQTSALENEIERMKSPKGGLNEHGQLTVQGSSLLNQKGEAIQLKGISSHGIRWYYEYLNYPALKYFRDKGANLVRLAVYTKPTGAYIDNPTDSLKTLYVGIENALAADCYAIVDWHILDDNDPNMHVTQAVEFFETVSARYANNPGIIYEICNEPNGTASWDDVVAYADQVIPVIRKNSPNAVIIVGTPKHCTDLRSAVEKPLDYDNVTYSYHLYTMTSRDGYRTEIPNAMQNNLAVFVSEWGINYLPGQEEINYRKASEFAAFMKQHTISWAFWSLSNKDEVYALLTPNTTRLNGWQEDDLTESGRLVLDLLKR